MIIGSQRLFLLRHSLEHLEWGADSPHHDPSLEILVTRLVFLSLAAVSSPILFAAVQFFDSALSLLVVTFSQTQLVASHAHSVSSDVELHVGAEVLPCYPFCCQILFLPDSLSFCTLHRVSVALQQAPRPNGHFLKMRSAFPLLEASIFRSSGNSMKTQSNPQNQMVVAEKLGHLEFQKAPEGKQNGPIHQLGQGDLQQTRFAAFEAPIALEVMMALVVAAAREPTVKENVGDAEAPVIAQVVRVAVGVWLHLYILGHDSFVVEHRMLVCPELEQYHFVERQQNHSAVAALHDFQGHDVHHVGVHVGMGSVPVGTGRRSLELKHRIGC